MPALCSAIFSAKVFFNAVSPLKFEAKGSSCALGLVGLGNAVFVGDKCVAFLSAAAATALNWGFDGGAAVVKECDIPGALRRDTSLARRPLSIPNNTLEGEGGASSFLLIFCGDGLPGTCISGLVRLGDCGGVLLPSNAARPAALRRFFSLSLSLSLASIWASFKRSVSSSSESELSSPESEMDG